MNQIEISCNQKIESMQSRINHVSLNLHQTHDTQTEVTTCASRNPGSAPGVRHLRAKVQSWLLLISVLELCHRVAPCLCGRALGAGVSDLLFQESGLVSPPTGARLWPHTPLPANPRICPLTSHPKDSVGDWHWWCHLRSPLGHTSSST